MARLARTPGLTDVQQDILATVREFVGKEIIPHAQHLEHADEYPEEIVAGMTELGLFGLTIAEEYGGGREAPPADAPLGGGTVPGRVVGPRGRPPPLPGAY